jgi:hypothetical protein
MANALSEEQWRNVPKLAEEVAELPCHERQACLESCQAARRSYAKFLALLNEFNAPVVRQNEILYALKLDLAENTRHRHVSFGGAMPTLRGDFFGM